MTPDQVHYGQTDEVHAARQRILNQAFHANPNRFVNKLRIPTKPAGYPGVESASHSNLIAATVPSSSRPGGVVSSGRF
jgi:hypothetical protein